MRMHFGKPHAVFAVRKPRTDRKIAENETNLAEMCRKTAHFVKAKQKINKKVLANWWSKAPNTLDLIPDL